MEKQISKHINKQAKKRIGSLKTVLKRWTIISNLNLVIKMIMEVKGQMSVVRSIKSVNDHHQCKWWYEGNDPDVSIQDVLLLE